MHVFVAEKELQARDIANALVAAPTKRFGFYECGDAVITWSNGHIYRQHEPHEYDERFADRRNISLLPIVPPIDGWRVSPEPSKVDILNTIQDLMRRASVIINACDPDREGQLIFDEILDNTDGVRPDTKVLRLDTNGGLSQAAVRAALGEMTDNASWRPITNAALARSQTDWLDGMNHSRAIQHSWWSSVHDKGVMSYGRVLVPTVKQVVDRDNEIARFVAQDYYVGYAVFAHGEAEFLTRWEPPDGLNGVDAGGHVLKREIVDKMVSRVIKQRGRVIDAKIEAEAEEAPLPHNLLTLQAEADRRYGLTAKQVLAAAQSLYAERLMITYPRTKSKYLPEDAHEKSPEVLHAIAHNDPMKSSLVNGANTDRRSRAFNNLKLKEGKQGIAPLAHFQDVSALPIAEQQVYDLICRAYIAQFYDPAIYQRREVEIIVDNDRFTASRRILQNPGWQACYPEKKAPDTTGMIPDDLAAGDRVTCTEAETVKKRTEPPRRFTNATLLERMVNIDELVEDPKMRKILADTEGLGTDATRADIIERAIEKYHYLERDGSFIQSTWRGKALIAGLPPNLTSPAPTAMLELILDHIAAGTIQREDYLLDYVGELTDALEKTKKIIFRATPPKNTDSGHPSKPRHDRGRAHRASTKFTILGP